MRAVAAPRPDAPPVTMNVLPFSSMASPSLCIRGFVRASTTVIAVAIRPAMSATFDGTISVLLVFARMPNALM